MRRRALLALAIIGGGVAAAGEPVAFGRDTPAQIASSDEATTSQMASFLYGSLFTEEQIVVPEALKRRAGELAAMTTDLNPVVRVQGSFALAVIGRGEVLTRTAFEPVTGAPAFEKANSVFLRCAVRRECQAAVVKLREMGAQPAKKAKPPQLANLEAVLLLSLIQQSGFAAYVDSLKTQDPGQQDALAVAKRRHAATFPQAR
jgi:hypothetical protein